MRVVVFSSKEEIQHYKILQDKFLIAEDIVQI